MKMTKQKLQKKALVVDDNRMVRDFYLKYGHGRFDCPQVSPDTLKILENLLRRNEYKVILMDGNLGLFSEEYFDGKILVNRIKQGFYGKVNQTTPILTISSESALDEIVNGRGPNAKLAVYNPEFRKEVIQELEGIAQRYLS